MPQLSRALDKQAASALQRASSERVWVEAATGTMARASARLANARIFGSFTLLCAENKKIGGFSPTFGKFRPSESEVCGASPLLEKSRVETCFEQGKEAAMAGEPDRKSRGGFLRWFRNLWSAI